MSWVRLDDGAPGHRKIVGLSDAAFRLWIVGLTYCNQQANDGRFSAASARIMTGYLASPELGRSAIAELCAAGLWAETADGYEVHDYLEYQPSQEERVSANKAAAERMRKMRAAKHGVREPLQRNNARTSDEVPAKFSLPDPVPSRPDPVPVFEKTVVPSEPSPPGLKLEPQSPADHKKPSAAQVRDQTALILFAELNQARLGVVSGSRAMEPRTAALAGLKACLAQGYTPDEIRRVIELKVKECRTDPSQAKWFTPTWFRPGNVERYLALRPQDVTSARPNPGYGRNVKPESDLEKLGRHFRERREARERGDVIDVESARMLDERRDNE